MLREVADTARFGRVTLQGDQVLSFGEKSQAGPGLINAGVYCLQREAFAPFALPQAFSIETDFFAPHALTLGLRGFITAGHFIDIGVPEDYDRAQTALPMWAAG